MVEKKVVGLPLPSTMREPLKEASGPTVRQFIASVV
jgi:hypothetical protein